MSLSQMQVFNEYIMPATIETLGQMVDKFNQSSGGAISLTTDGFTGDFMQRSFFQSIHASVRRVDRYAPNTVAPVTDLSQIKESGVKVAGGFGPIRFEPSQLTWLQKPTAEGIEVASRNFAEALMADQLNTAIAGLVAALSNQPDATNDVSAAQGVAYDALNAGHAKFGDSSGNLITEVMTGAAYHKFVGANLANANRLYDSTTVRVIDILGRLVVVTDAPALFEAGAPDKDKILSLAAQAAVVYDGSDVIPNIETSNGNLRIETTMQVDYTFGLSINGYTWDETNGGKSPSDAALATGTNWAKTATDIKHTAGVITIGAA